MTEDIKAKKIDHHGRIVDDVLVSTSDPGDIYVEPEGVWFTEGTKALFQRLDKIDEVLLKLLEILEKHTLPVERKK